MNRKKFLKTGFGVGAGLLLPGGVRNTLLRRPVELSILYTNDTHSRIDPFPENAIEHAGMGGMTRRGSLITAIRQTGVDTLLLDAGDIFNGTPWFQYHQGRVELKLMSQMGYDASALGEHELINGPEGFAEVAGEADFPFLCANYRVRGTALEPFVRQFVIRERGGFRIGIFGLGVNFYGLLNPEQYGEIRYGDPFGWAQRIADHLRGAGRCDYVICLSHLGFEQPDNEPDDCKLAREVKGIDLIIGGHTHTFMDHPVSIIRPDGERTLVTQAGHSGLRLGRIDLSREEEGRPVVVTSLQTPVV